MDTHRFVYGINFVFHVASLARQSPSFSPLFNLVTKTAMTDSRLREWQEHEVFCAVYLVTVASPAIWSTGARAPPRLLTISFLVHFGVSLKLTAIYCVVCEISWCKCQQLKFDQYCISHKTSSHQAAAAPLKFAVSAL